MSAEVVAQTIQLVIAPAVMISACATIQSDILGRYSNIGTRLRSLTRERLELLMIRDMPDRMFGNALFLLDSQLKSLSRRHLLIKTAALVLYGAILWFLFSMLAISAAKMLDRMLFALIAFTLFLLGTFTLMLGVLLASSEIWMSHKAVQSEVRWAMTLAKLEHF